MLITLDGLGQCHTLLHDAVSLQAISYCSVLSAVSSFSGEAADRALDYTWILHKLMDRFDGLATLLVLAN
jgi:hypothetical protein